MNCPKCSSDHFYVGWRTILADIPPFRDEADQLHSHAHGILKLNLLCRDCKHEWNEQVPVPLRCWCGWYNGN